VRSPTPFAGDSSPVTSPSSPAPPASEPSARNELLGLRWNDFDPTKATLSINRGLVAIGYDVHETRGKTRNARRRIDLDPTTVALLTAWRHWQQTEQQAIGIEPSNRMFTDGHGASIHPHAISQTFERIARRARVRVIRLHDLRHTHASLLIAAGGPVKVVSERLGHASPTFTIETYQHVLPGMQAEAPSSSNTSSPTPFYRPPATR
jgi:integrase